MLEGADDGHTDRDGACVQIYCAEIKRTSAGTKDEEPYIHERLRLLNDWFGFCVVNRKGK